MEIFDRQIILQDAIKDAEWRLGSYLSSECTGKNDFYAKSQISKIHAWSEELAKLALQEDNGLAHIKEVIGTVDDGKSLRELFEMIAQTTEDTHAPVFMVVIISEANGSISTLSYSDDIPAVAKLYLSICDEDMRYTHDPARFIEDVAIASQVADRRREWTL